MTKQSYYLADNSPEIRQELKEAGIDLCRCCEFEDAIWLHYIKDTNRVHGVGYKNEIKYINFTPQGMVQSVLWDDIEYGYDVTIVHDVKDFIKLIRQ